MSKVSVVREVGVASANHPRYLRRNEAAKYITTHYFPMAPRTLAKLACIGGGPRFRKAGRIPVYTPSDLDEYAERKLSPLLASTSDLEA
jgi:hypothetical protein